MLFALDTSEARSQQHCKMAEREKLTHQDYIHGMRWVDQRYLPSELNSE